MAMNFPNSPTVGAIYQAPGGPTYRWSGTLWEPMVGTPALIVPGRNKIINGLMRVNQRGATTTNVVGAYLIDRWCNASSVTNATLVSALSELSLSGSNHLYIQTTTVLGTLTSTTYASIRTRIEGYDAADLNWGTGYAKPLTISFRASPSVAGRYTVAVSNADATRTYCAAVDMVTGNNDYSITIPGCTDGVWNVINGIGVSINFVFACGTTYTAPVANVWNSANYLAAPGQVNGLDTLNRYLAITDVQAETGLIATPFEVVPISDDLARCQRYFEGGSFAIITNAYAGGAFVGGFVPYNTTKRAPGTVVLGTPSENVNISTSPLSTSVLGNNGFRVWGSSTNAGSAYHTNSFTCSAEL